MDVLEEDLTTLIRDHKLSTEAADKDLSTLITQLNEKTVANANKASKSSMETNVLLDNTLFYQRDMNLLSQINVSNDKNDKLK
jgi:hypothetical protein